MDAPPPDDRDGLKPATTTPARPGALPAGTASFVRFLRANGSVDWASWQRSEPAIQDALEAAGEIVARERAAMVAEEVVALAGSVQQEPAKEPPGDPLVEAGLAALRARP